MLKYIIKKIIILLITLWVVITVSFFLMRIAPGNPFLGEKSLTEEALKNLMHAYGLDKPLWIQYFNYIWNLLHGDFGPSYKMLDFSATQLIIMSAPISISLTLMAVIVAVTLGVIIGSFAALNQNSKLDYAVMSVSMIGIILPSYAMAPILTLIFGIYLKILPIAGWDGITNKILPVVGLSLPLMAYITRLTRGSMLEVLNTNYIRTAYAKGLSKKIVILRHALKPALIPVVSFLGPTIATLMTGSVVIETIFDLPGLGRYFVQGSLNRDYNLVLGIVVFYAFMVLTLNFLSDILYALLDPKIRLDK